MLDEAASPCCSASGLCSTPLYPWPSSQINDPSRRPCTMPPPYPHHRQAAISAPHRRVPAVVLDPCPSRRLTATTMSHTLWPRALLQPPSPLRITAEGHTTAYTRCHTLRERSSRAMRARERVRWFARCPKGDTRFALWDRGSTGDLNIAFTVCKIH
jgi:hypothetical protein